MSAPVGTVFEQKRTAIEEVISKSVHTFACKMDPVWRDMVATSMGVQQADSRDFVVHKLLEFLLPTGRVDPIQKQGGWTLFGEGGVAGTDFDNFGNVIQRRSPSTTFLDPFEGPRDRPLRLSVPMRGMSGNLGITLDMAQQDATSAVIVKEMAKQVSGHAMHYAKRLCEAWYTSQRNNYRLCNVGTAATTGAPGTHVLDSTARTITLYPSNEAIGRFCRGDQVDIVREDSGATFTRITRVNDTSTANGDYANAAAIDTHAGAQAGNPATRIRAFVTVVDRLVNKVVIAFDNKDTAGTAATFTTWCTATTLSGAFVCRPIPQEKAYTAGADSLLEGIAGLNSWMKFGSSATNTTIGYKRDSWLLGLEAIAASGVTFNGTIDVNEVPELKSFLKSVGGPLTEHTFGIYLDRVASAFAPQGHYIDTLVTTTGVLRAYQQTKIGRELIDRTGRLSSMTSEGAPNEFTYTHNGRKYMFHTSEWQEAGTLDGYRRQGNYKRYVPPTPQGLRTMGNMEGGAPVRFVAPFLTGTDSPRLPYRNSSSRPTNAYEMPSVMHVQIIPEHPAGMRLTGLTESREFSDTPSSTT